MTKSRYLDLLAFAPHPDDAELYCGGLLAKMADAGHAVGIVDLTRGEMSSRGDVDDRKEEADAAAKVLGLTYRENLGLPDAGIRIDEDREHAPQRKAIVACLRRLRPEIVLLPYWRERHPDHENASRLIRSAIFFADALKYQSHSAQERFAPKRVLYYQMRYEFEPSFLVDISGVAGKKDQAIRCYKTQIGVGDGRESEGPTTLLSSPRTLQAIEARDRHLGAMIGVDRAEAYLAQGHLKVNDPVGFFRENLVDEIHLFPGWA